MFHFFVLVASTEHFELTRAWEEYLAVNRLEFDPNRLIHRNCKKPQKEDPFKMSKAPEGNEPETFEARY